MLYWIHFHRQKKKLPIQNTIKVLFCFDILVEIDIKKEKRHWSENNTDPDISFNEETKLFHCQTAGCATTAKYKYNIVKHLKLCYSPNKNQRKVADNKICKACRKEFSKMSNRDRHSQQFHAEKNHNSVTEDEIGEKGTKTSQKKELLVKIIQIHKAISYLLVKNF